MIDLNREQFEKLSEIAERLHTVFYNEDLNQYHAAMINSALSVKYIQGAWYAFQEQQKKLDCCREENKAHLEKIDEAIARCKFLKTNGGDRRTLEDIELILKGAVKMKANEYIKKYGVDCAKEILKHNQDLMNISFFIDLKRLIESHDYIECLGGYQLVKENLPSGYFGDGDYKDLIQKCLEDTESCK